MNMLPEVKSFLQEPKLNLINNQWLPGSEGEIEVINPATEEIITKLSATGKSEVDMAVELAKHCFHNVWKKQDPSKIESLLHGLANLMERDKEILIQLETLDNGKPLDKAAYDIQSSIDHFRYYAGWPSKIEGSTHAVGAERIAKTVREPLGVVGLITPWNFPLMISTWKLAPALASGNCCILKPSEHTSLSVLYLGQLSIEAGFPPGVISILCGHGGIAGKALTEHPKVAKISFTGSTATGKSIMSTCAKTLKSISLELGGKSPVVIFEDAPIEKLAESLVWSSFYNTGQECTLGSRIYVQKGIFSKVKTILIEQAKKLKIGNGFEQVDLGPITTKDQLLKTQGYLSKAKELGHEILLDGEENQFHKGYFAFPSIIQIDDQNSPLIQKEIFGPIVTITAFETYEEALKMANGTEYGLAAAVWTQNIATAHQFSKDLNAGTIWINGYDMFSPSVPFGGFKNSGIGKEMGKSAIDLYTKEKAIWINL